MFLILILIVALAGCRPTTDEQQSTQTSASEASGSVDLFTQGHWVDLTHTFNDDTIYWPTADNFRFIDQTAGETPGGYFYAANSFATAEHGGTHIDAPIHFAREHQTVDQIPLSRLIGEAVVVDVSDRCATNPDYQVTLSDLRAWEEKHNRQLVDVIVLFKHDIPALENVANLAVLPETGFHVIALPMKIGNGSGGPTRIVAVLPPSPDRE